MICSNCLSPDAHHIVTNEQGESCEHCSNISVASKTTTDGILTRNSWRVRRQQSRFEGDIIRPHAYDSTTHRERVNPEFLKRYPDKVKEFFKPEELVRDGYKEMPAKIAKNKARNDKLKAQFKKDTIYAGSSKRAVENFLSDSPVARQPAQV